MGTITQISLDELFALTTKRMQILENYIDRFSGLKHGIKKDKRPEDIEYYESLSDEGKEKIHRKVLKAMDMKNEILRRRKEYVRTNINFGYN